MNVRTSGPLGQALVVLVVVDATIAIVLRAELGAEYVRGDRGWVQLLALIGLLSSTITLWLLWRVCRRYMSMRQSSEQSSDAFIAVMATSHEWLWEATPDLTFVSCSTSASDLLGYTPQEMVGKSAFDMVDAEFVPEMRKQLAVAIEERTGWRNLYARWHHKDGHVVETLGSAVPVLDSRGTVVGFRGARQQIDNTATSPQATMVRSRIQSYLLNDDVTIALQPVVNLIEGSWHNAEALARFPDGRPPDVCFAEAHGVGLGVELELLAVRHALEHLHLLPTGVRLSVNASAELILDGRLHELLARPGLDLTRLMLEITEHTPISDYDQLRATLAPLRLRGVRIVVDDTGAGYASFRHVLHLRPDAIKLDRSLLEDLQRNPAARALITAVVVLAQELGATVTAEGIESYADLVAVASLGVDDAQGYYLARPTTDAIQWAGWSQTDWTVAVGHRVSAV